MAKDGEWGETERSREMRRLFARHARSGLKLSEFARREDLKAATLYWRRRLLDAEGTVPPSVSFTEVSAVAAAGGRGFEVVLDGGTMVRVPERFESKGRFRPRTCASGSGCSRQSHSNDPASTETGKEWTL